MTFVWIDDAVLPQWKERGANPRLGLGQAQKKIMEKLDAVHGRCGLSTLSRRARVPLTKGEPTSA